jgi:hypothetical protein
MKTLIKAAVAATVATGLFASPALAASAGTGKFTANAKIVKPVTLTKGDDLDFGTTTMLPALDSTGATVTVGDQTGDKALCSDPTMLSCSGGKPASFTMSSGVGGQTVQISYNNAPTKLTILGGGTSTVDFALKAVPNVTLLADGTGAFNVGGTITVKNTTVDGTYAATVDIVANYL